MNALTQETAFDELDLDVIVSKGKEKHQWSTKKALEVEKRYRGFLQLIAKYPQHVITPSRAIDDLWHIHILHTRKYMADCEMLFGKYLHHTPNKNSENATSLDFERTKALFRKEFGFPMEIPSLQIKSKGAPISSRASNFPTECDNQVGECDSEVAECDNSVAECD